MREFLTKFFMIVFGRGLYIFFLLHLLPAFACSPALRWDAEMCAVADQTQQLRQDFTNKFNLDMDQIAEYRALRFIDRKSWEASLKKNVWFPWKVYSPSPETWLRWEKGESYSLRLLLDSHWNLADLREIHRSGLTSRLMSWWSTHLKGAGPGRVRNRFFQLAPSFTIRCTDKVDAEAFARVWNYDLHDKNGIPLVTVMKQHEGREHGRRLKTFEDHKCPDRIHYQAEVLYLSSRRVLSEIDRWIRAVNESRSNEWKHEYDPVKRIAELQRWFVSIHPFGDGNGRVSRWIQDVLLRELGLPYLASGDLQDDITAHPLEYRLRFRYSIFRQLRLLQDCFRNLSEAREIGAPILNRCRPIYQPFEADSSEEAESKRNFLRLWLLPAKSPI
jgi:hypothetical protein